MSTSFADAAYIKGQKALAALAASTMSAVNFSASVSRKPKKVRYRSAKSGRFVKPGYAKRYPHLTVGERVQ